MERLLYFKSAINKELLDYWLGHRLPEDETVKLKFVSELIQIASLRFFKALGGIKDYSNSSSELFKKRLQTRSLSQDL